ncbi:uncharacterized protein EDB91DRAFT_1156416 [Suillus paluster]|uniref:uncharacterized protein n=1 Tax=Suillus paluster TaxID=48578 RepID=UPI001B867FC2|nr:uncharacterized protein EDB91DRAFT_1156416 [Suillus paluster]KAG1730660.1 hypothetical protein EDB91DRAFT_1156416 [Suillus paluster]
MKTVTYYVSSSSRRTNFARAGPDKRWSMMGLPEVNVQDYYQRLIDRHLIPGSQTSQDPSPISLRPRCPICSHRLMACSSCSVVTCGANPRCAGGDLVPMLSCCSYDKMMFCTDCVTENYSGLLSECVLCEANYCSRLMTKFTTAVWKKCDERSWEPHEHDDQGVCLHCIESIHGHVACPCGRTWVCGVCAQKKEQKSGRRCPRCQTFYCFYWCEYMNICAMCQKATLCSDCMEEDMSGEEGSSLTTHEEGSSRANKGVVLVETCEKCRLGICSDCATEYVFDLTCGACENIHCQDCGGDERCTGCGVPLCLNCIETNSQCPCGTEIQDSEDESSSESSD